MDDDHWQINLKFFLYLIAAIECPSLSLTDGSVAYADTSPELEL